LETKKIAENEPNTYFIEYGVWNVYYWTIKTSDETPEITIKIDSTTNTKY